MNRRYCNLIDDFLDESLTNERMSDFRNHLNECPACAAELAQVNRLEALICDAWSEVMLPRGFESNSLTTHQPPSTSGKHPGRKRSGRVAAWLTLAALAGAIVLTFFLTFPKHSDIPIANSTSELELLVSPVAFYDTGDSGTMIAPVVSNSEFTIVQAFPKLVSNSISTPNRGQNHESN